MDSDQRNRERGNFSGNLSQLIPKLYGLPSTQRIKVPSFPERCWREHFFACCTEEVLAQYITDKNKESRSPQSLLPVIIFINIYHRNRCWLEVHETWKIISFISRGYRAGVIFHRILSCFLASFATVKGRVNLSRVILRLDLMHYRMAKGIHYEDVVGIKTGNV
ncbi:hypothetical protein CEXT_812811 [Caerostris extrusa]|uniref:Uncharacterized protein n=1 Tax=Caerostris extrusa TaxID=172846 RepID=A0AAV4NCH2_CAEEX|nr:hypothetical protein CEXT_812811 [Caerostris extrusa]